MILSQVLTYGLAIENNISWKHKKNSDYLIYLIHNTKDIFVVNLQYFKLLYNNCEYKVKICLKQTVSAGTQPLSKSVKRWIFKPPSYRDN